MEGNKVYSLKTIMTMANMLIQGNSKCANLAQAVQVFRNYGWNVIRLADEDKFLIERIINK